MNSFLLFFIVLYLNKFYTLYLTKINRQLSSLNVNNCFLTSWGALTVLSVFVDPSYRTRIFQRKGVKDRFILPGDWGFVNRQDPESRDIYKHLKRLTEKKIKHALTAYIHNNLTNSSSTSERAIPMPCTEEYDSYRGAYNYTYKCTPG